MTRDTMRGTLVYLFLITLLLLTVVPGRGAEIRFKDIAIAAPAGAQRFGIVAGESQVLYHVAETLFLEGNRFNVAVGTTTVIRGEITVDRANPRNSRIGKITIDISQFKSDSQRRDNFIRTRSLESARFPTAEFTPTTLQGLPATYAEGQEIVLQVTGNLKIRDVVRPTTFATTIKIVGTQLTGTATTTIKLTDFGFDPPSIAGILRTENEAKLEFRIVARASQ